MQLAALTLIALPALAQSHEHDEKSCEKAVKIVAKGHVEARNRWAFAMVTRCKGGGSALAAAWQRPPRDPDALTQLVHRSGNISDRRILDAAMSVLQSPTDEPRRRAALRAVVAQYNPSYTMMSTTWDDPETSGLGRQSDYYQVPGEQPVNASDRARVVAAMRTIAASDADAKWRRLATRLASDLAAIP
jgi:hypothetical protein